jgi:hypothetical protein
MDLPNGRAKLYQLFSQEGNDIIVNFPNKYFEQVDTGNDIIFREVDGEPISIRFKNGVINHSSTGRGINYGCLGLSYLEKAYSFKRGHEPSNPITKYEMESLVDVDGQMSVLEGGHSTEFLSTILGYHYNNNGDYWSSGKITGRNIDFPSNNFRVEDAISLIKDLANNDDVLLHFSTLHLYGNRTTLEQTLSAPDNLYSNHAYTIKGFDEERGLVYFTNPWNGAQITEMDIYTFLGYIDRISYMEL